MKTFVDEVLRAVDHAGIVFRPGPTGSRAALACGPDVWEVIGVAHAVRDEQPGLAEDALLTQVASVTGLSGEQVAAAMRYCAEFGDEIDRRIWANLAAGGPALISES
ncbi:hypothetical protein [Pilimelia terevasa]|uniref:hypothetical protein n=1 Tax=Pilimelia terevasa TaxID=53372 RepID=UPI001669A40B|nr:hypothetical protein [Pilimelia terevasa]